MSRSSPYNEAMAEEERNRRIEEYLPLVRFVVGRLALEIPPNLDREDLHGHGVLGLIHAAQTFDPERGVSFKTHAYIHIRGAVLDELRRMDFLPRSRREKVKIVERAKRELEQSFGRKPSPEEIAQSCDMDLEELDEVILAGRTAQLCSIDSTAPSPGGEELRLKDVLGTSDGEDPFERVALEELKQKLASCIQNLPENERRVIVLYYAEGLLLRDIGEILGVSESRVSQIHGRALARLNHELCAASGMEVSVGD